MATRWRLIAAVVLLFGTIVTADEGMWLFNHPPAQAIESAYHFTVTPTWLEHVQKASVRFNNGGSGSFVSADGLTFTNHHVAQTCLHAISTAERDLYVTGFYARTESDEAKCPDLELNVLMSLDDVTGMVNAGISPDMSASDAGARQRANTAEVEAACNRSTGLRCQVVSFYSSSIYHLYRYKKYTDVRLVFAPEFGIAFFGGDPDNFEYPRYDLDVAFFRVYENDRPAKTDHYFPWSTSGVADGDIVFVSGHPGSTDRQRTLAQLAFLRDVGLPWQLEIGTRRQRLLTSWGSTSPERFRRAQEILFGIENNLKRNRVYHSTLLDEGFITAKRTDEHALRTAFARDGAERAGRGDPWLDIEKAMGIEREIYLPYVLLERDGAFAGALAGYAHALVRAAAERPKPNALRLPEFSDANLPSLEQRLFADEPVYPDLEEVQLADSLAMLEEKLPSDAVTREILDGRSPAVVARGLIAASRLGDPGVRRTLYQGGEAAIQASTDPLIVLMRTIDPQARRYRTRFDNEVASVERMAGGTIGRFRFTTSGYGVPPDATFTLRLSYGSARGYVEDGLGHAAPKGSRVPAFTTIRGAFDRAAAMGHAGPFRLPETWLDARRDGRINLDTPLNFASTADIIGGNSGSPVLNRAGEIVGIIFDGNMQSLPWRYRYDTATGRAISVDARGILEALRNIYGATRVVDELGARPAERTH
jgi:hypothetical protein